KRKRDLTAFPFGKRRALRFRCTPSVPTNQPRSGLSRRAALPTIRAIWQRCRRGGSEMTRINRRRFVQMSGAAAAAGSGGLATIIASGRAPAYAQGTTVHWLRWSDFVPASDQLLKQKIVPQCEKDLGIKLNLESVNANDIQARITSAVQS